MAILDALFIVNLSLLAVHELDAVHKAEWRMIFPFSRLSDPAAFRLFTAAHIPLFIALLALFTVRADPDWAWTVFAFDGFLVLHLALHLAFLKHPQNGFANGFSFTLIGALACGGATHGILAAGLL